MSIPSLFPGATLQSVQWLTRARVAEFVSMKNEKYLEKKCVPIFHYQFTRFENTSTSSTTVLLPRSRVFTKKKKKFKLHEFSYDIPHIDRTHSN